MTTNELLEQIKLRISKETWNNWLSTAKVLEIEGDSVRVGLGNIFIKETVEKRFGSVITDAVTDALGKKVSIVFSEIPIQESSSIYSGPIIKNRPLKLSEVNTEFTFESFIVGINNKIAYQSSLEVSRNPGKYNPLFIYGDVGIGKTHLLHAIANYVMEHSPDLRIMYMTAEDFMNEMMKAIRNQSMDDFRERLRKTIDILLLDDIQFLIGKNTAQTELFHTFNSLFNAGKQVVICSDRTPEELSTFNSRLISRFEMGFLACIEHPDTDTRFLIAKKMANLIPVELSDEVAMYIAQNVDSNLRKLRGTIMNLMLHSKMSGKNLDLNETKKILKLYKLGNDSKKIDGIEIDKNIKVNNIISAVLSEFRLEKQELYSNSRKKSVAQARQLLAYMLKVYTKLNVNEISKELKRNHSTISQSIKKVEQSLLVGNNILKSQLDEIKTKIEEEDLDFNVV